MPPPIGCPPNIRACRLAKARTQERPRTLPALQALAKVEPLGHMLDARAFHERF